MLNDSRLKSSIVGLFLFRIFNSVFYFIPILISNLRFRYSLLFPLYRRKDNNKVIFVNKKQVIYMVQKETTFSGGLSDRLRGIIAIYAECKKQNLPFSLIFEPLHLQNYLVPNQYDWHMEDSGICWDISQVYPCTLLTYHSSSKNKYQHFVQNLILRWYLRKPFRQIHIYSNMICKDEDYGPLFNELFKPSVELQKQIDYHLKNIGGKFSYISCTFRFRQLLGDFKEDGDILPYKERYKYLKRCVATVVKLHEVYPNLNILVTSDSSTFLDSIKELSYVYLIPGEVVHLGFTFDANLQTYMKSFVDMFMLSYASTVYLVRDDLMYHSGFPYRAALLHGTKYKEINLV